MTDVELILHLRSLGVRLWLDGDALRFSAPRGVLTAELKEELRARKEPLVAFLQRAPMAAPAPPITRAPRGEGMELSFAQQRLWFLDRLDPGGSSYNVPFALRLSGALDRAALGRAVQEIVRRHEALRTTFAERGGRPSQVIHAAAEIALPFEDLGELPAAEREAAMRRRVAEEGRRPFDLAAGPVFRAMLFGLGEAEHVLFYSMHHIVSDGWSNGVFVREIGALYEAFRAGKPSPLAELPIQYADYAAWQRAWLSGDTLDRQLAYWKRQLEGAPRVLELPADRPRPASRSLRGGRRAVTVPAVVAAALAELSQREGATLFMTLLAAFDALLYRYTGQGDIVVGTPIANRRREETEGLIGFFVNTLVLRTAVSDEIAFRELVRRVKDVALGAYAHQDMPFERIVQELEPERDPSRTPLFQVSFALQNAPGGEGMRLAGLELRGVAAEGTAAKFDLTLAMSEGPRGLGGAVEYAADLFDEATIDRMIGHLGVLLAGIARDPDARIGALPLLGEEERRRLLVEWNATERAYPGDRLLHELFEEQAARTPDAPAVVFDGLELSYRELDEGANRLANHLRSLGVGPDVLVGVCMERSIELVAALLGVLKAGGAYVPLDPSYPKERLDFMIADAGAKVLLTQERLRGLLPETAATVVALDTETAIEEASAEPPRCGESEGRGERLAYVMYTSGSTGRPKGALIPHRAIVNHMRWMAETWPLGAEDAVLQKTPMSFDASVWELYAPLLAGARLVMAEPEGHRDPAHLVQVIVENRVTVLQLVPSMLELLLLEPGLGRCVSLKRVYCGGEALSRSLTERLMARLGAEVVNLYGPTECAIDATYWVCDRAVGPSGVTEPIGRPIANLRAYVLDRGLSPVPIGVPGELCLGGAGVGRGYLGRPELTAERFIADPFAGGGADSRMYRTGDRARWLASGVLEYLGRVDQQVKIRGYRIELGEIEAAIAQHPSVRDVVVIAREDSHQDRRLVAYVVPSSEARSSAAELRAHVKAQLPDYMVPAAFVTLDALPLMPNGKVDRGALPAPDEGVGAIEGASAAPRGPIEEAIAGIFADVLRAPAVGPRDGFFALGGHSLLATQAIARLRDTLGVELPLRALFEAPSPAELAERVEAALHDDRGGLAPPIVRGPAGAAGPLSFAQQRLWFLDRLEPGDAAYVMPLAIRFLGGLDMDALELALSELVRRHEVLRTAFTLSGDEPIAVVRDDIRVELGKTSLASLPGAEREEALRAGLANERRPFDLATGPLLRARLFEIGAQEHVLSLAIHHIASDGWSMGVLNREVGALYEAFRAGRPSPLGELPIQYVDYARWQREVFSGEALERQLAYWKAALDGAPRAIELPTDRPRPPVQTSRGARHLFTIPAATAKALKELSQREGVTLFMTLLAAFDVLLQRYSGQGDVVVGSPIANRTRAEVEGLIGFFVNTLVLRVEVPDELPFRELLRRVREVCLGAYAHQDMPFERLVQELAGERDRSRSPLFQVLFSLQNTDASGGRIDVSGVRLRPVKIDQETSKFDLTFSLSDGVGGPGIGGAIEYRTDLFDAATIERMAGHYAVLLAAILDDAGRAVWQLPILDEAERQTLLVEWNRTAAEYPRELCVHELFAAQAARTPEAIAAVFEGETLTYRALGERANRLANHLRKLGVGPEVLVGLFMRRSLDMMVGILGILEAGGAYVPLDPSHPIERLAWMLEDSAAPVVVTEEALADELPVQGAVLVRLDADRDAIAAESAEDPRCGVGPSNLAYIIYTSGSTGRPKGVMIHHRGLVNYLAWAIKAYPTDEGRGAPVHSSIGFDLTVTGLFAPLLAGKAVTLVREEGEIDALVAALRDTGGFSLVKLTPAHLEVMSQLLPPESAAGSTRALVIGGEALSWEALAFWRKHAPETRLVNEYGPTETVVGCCVYDAARPGDFRGSVPIGRPIANTALHVLDRHLQPSPIGVPGELYIGGDGVARGYWNRPDLTAERFIADPFAPEGAESRLYRTGDLARWLPSGDLEFLGRVDHQVKIRGYRIELGEIESVLGQHAQIAEVAVVAREDSMGDKRLVAYVVAREQPAPGAAELRGFLEQRLPGYMVPSAFVALAAMPLTPNGKIDRRALPAPEARAGDLQGDLAPPRSPTEEALAGIWAEVLGLPRVGVQQGFFDLGGHSLLATQVMSRIATSLGVELPLQALFEAPTVAELAARVDAELQSGHGIAAPPLARVPREEATALSFGQERLWFLDQLQPGDPAYIVPAALRLDGAIETAALERALAEIVRRHEVLRTTFVTLDGRPVPVIHEGTAIPLRVDDLRALPVEDRWAAARREASAEARRPFDLATGPLLRARLVIVGDEERLLLITLHHIVSDAWSQGILTREILTLYSAFRGGRPSPLPELSIQYADYAHWQRRWLSGEAIGRQLAYWKQRLDGAPRAIDLPADRPRPAVQSHRGATRSFRVPDVVAVGIEELSRAEGATPFMTLLAAFDVLLARITGQSDIVIGTPVANRTRAETEQLIGFFLNTLALRVEIPDGATFRELLRRVKDTCLGAYAHQDVPFERLVQELAPERDMSRSPLFQVSFTVQGAVGAPVAVPGVKARAASADVTTAKFDLTLGMGLSASGLVGVFEYATDLFDEATIDRMIGHTGVLLAGIVSNPGARIEALPLLGEEERRTLLVEWNATERAYPGERLLHELFEQQADETPDSPAVVFGAHALTYRELDLGANRLANHLRSLGVGPDVLVGVCMERSIELVAALLGVLKAGGAYVPLDPSYPKDRLDFMIADAGAKVLLTQERLRELLPETAATVVALDTEAALSEASAERPECAGEGRGERLAYVIYTSGSTGKPKGALIPHRAIVNHMRWMAETWPLGAEDAVLQKTPMSFDASVWEFYAPLLSGARLVMAEPEGHRDPAYLVQAVVDNQVTVLQLVPSMLELLLLEPGLERCVSLKRVYCGGEALSRALTERLMARLGAEVVNLYGPTECAIDATYWVCDRAAGPSGLTEPIGRPIANLRAYVLDRGLSPVPVGVPGELCLGGAGVGRGYLGRPELTAERFIADPFAGGGVQERMYRTGDRVRWLASGVLEYLGRVDQQVKIRGYRIELGEIEAAIAEHPAVREAVVIAREDRPGERRLVAYTVAVEGPPPTATELRAHVKERLPDYMIPSAFVLLPRLPLMENGKVDRRALPAPEAGDRPVAESTFVAPRGAVEAELARIWASVLRIENVGVHDNFFAVGGDSILSIQIVARARQAGLFITPRQIFQHQTVAELAEVAGTAAVVEAEQGPVIGPAPLTPIQRAFLEEERAELHHYNQAFFFEVNDALDPALLEEAVSSVFEHHDALRLRLSRDGGAWRQTIAAPGGPAPFRRLALHDLPAGDRRAAIERAAADAQASLDLAAGPVGRVVLFDLGPGEPQRLLLAIHHLAIDGVSWRILLEDLWSAYAQRRCGEAMSLPAKTTSFKRWGERLEEHARGEALSAEEAHWLSARGERAGRLPVDHEHGEITERSARHVTVSLDAGETESLLRDVPDVYRTQINDVLLTALAQAFEQWTGSPALLVDLEGHGREELFADVDLTRTVGWFTALFPVVIEADPLAGPGAALMAVKEQLREVPNRGIGYGILRHLREGDSVSERLRALPQAEVSFNYLGQFEGAAPEGSSLRGAREASGPTASPEGRRRYLIEVNASVSAGRLHARFTYSEARHLAATIEELAARFVSSLRALISHCLSPDAGGATPSDFQNADLTQDLIDMVAAFDPSAEQP